MRRRTKIILAIIGTVIAWPFVQIALMVAQAQYFAEGRPYCIAVPGDLFLSYAPVGSLFQLNGFTLHAPYIDSSGSLGLARWSFHALLVIDAGGTFQWRNWSYWHQNFDRLTPQQAKATHLYGPACQPQIDFLWKLPLLAK